MTRWGAVALSAVALIATGCSVVPDLRRDRRVRILSPPDHVRTRTPLQMRWRGPAGPYAVFVDRSPIAPGGDLDALIRGDPGCRFQVACRTPDWLSQRGVYVIRGQELTLRYLDARSGRRAGAGRRHVLTLVRLDRRGVRLGEGAWSVSVYIPAGTG